MLEQKGRISALIANHLHDLIVRRGIVLGPIGEDAIAEGVNLNDPSAWLPLSQCRKMIHSALAESKDPLLGLRLSQTTFPTGFGIVGVIAQACPSLAEIIQTVSRYESLIGNIFQSSLLHEPGRAIWALDVNDSDLETKRFMVEFSLGARHELLRLIREKRSNVVIEVRFQFPAPTDEQSLQTYHHVFNCPVLFDQPHSGLVLKINALDLPMRHMDLGLKQPLQDAAEKQLRENETPPTLTDRARERLALLLDQGSASREALASALGISSRHLHRELRQQGTRYSLLLDEIRQERATAFLRTNASLERIGNKLGFHDTSSFMRWYRQRTGQTAGHARAQNAENANDTPENE